MFLKPNDELRDMVNGIWLDPVGLQIVNLSIQCLSKRVFYQILTIKQVVGNVLEKKKKEYAKFMDLEEACNKVKINVLTL